MQSAAERGYAAEFRQQIDREEVELARLYPEAVVAARVNTGGLPALIEEMNATLAKQRGAKRDRFPTF